MMRRVETEESIHSQSFYSEFLFFVGPGFLDVKEPPPLFSLYSKSYCCFRSAGGDIFFPLAHFQMKQKSRQQSVAGTQRCKENSFYFTPIVFN